MYVGVNKRNVFAAKTLERRMYGRMRRLFMAANTNNATRASTRRFHLRVGVCSDELRGPHNDTRAGEREREREREREMGKMGTPLKS